MDLLQADYYDYQVLADISQQYNPHDGDEATTALKKHFDAFNVIQL